MKTCTKCGEEKPLTKFNKYKKTANRCAACKACDYARCEETRRANPSRDAISRRRAHAKLKYGISVEEYDSCMETSVVCEICRKGGKTLCYDHDHNTMEFRGVLCTQCNAAIGVLGDDEEGLSRALEYLRR